MMPMILGLTGKAHAGKDTVAKILRDAHRFERLAFADPLKDAAAALFGVPRHHFDNPSLKEVRNRQWGFSPRQMLQVLGTNMVRSHLGEDFWTKRMTVDLKMFMPYQNVVITDVRFENEAQFVRGMGGTLVHVIRPGAGLDGETGRHISEAGIKPLERDLFIHNEGTLEELETRVNTLYQHLYDLQEGGLV